VRETANQAANHAREAIAAIVPDSAAALAQASREAVVGAVTNPVQAQLAEISAAAERATDVARQASERLTRQLLVMGETAVAIEARISDDEAAREERGAENLTRRVSLLIEALNSTAIDVNKILSNEVDDTAWTAYLKGDRGVFTRRAVRLLDSGERARSSGTMRASPTSATSEPLRPRLRDDAPRVLPSATAPPSASPLSPPTWASSTSPWRKRSSG
jgi:hypothetical protein